jgi:predicted DNA-binding ribbon-helix-helix protein
MTICMKVTLDIPDVLYAKIKKIAAQEKTTISALVAEALEIMRAKHFASTSQLGKTPDAIS